MTDEEMAEEYADRTRIVDENTRAGTDCISLVQDYEGNVIDIHERIKQAFLAGLKAGRPEWHKVADGDLPKEEGKFLVCYETEDGYYRNIFILNYTEYDESLHWCDEAFETYDESIIAWCEIPKYTEE